MLAVVRPKFQKSFYSTLTPAGNQVVCCVTPKNKTSSLPLLTHGIIKESKTHSVKLSAISFDGFLQQSRIFLIPLGFLKLRNKCLFKVQEETRDTFVNRIICFFMVNDSAHELKLTVLNPASPSIGIDRITRVLIHLSQVIEKIDRSRIDIPLGLDASYKSLIGFSFPHESSVDEHHLIRFRLTFSRVNQLICSIIHYGLSSVSYYAKYLFELQNDLVDAETYYQYFGTTNISRLLNLYSYSVFQNESYLEATTLLLSREILNSSQYLWSFDYHFGGVASLVKEILLTLASSYQSDNRYNFEHHLRKVSTKSEYQISMVSIESLIKANYHFWMSINDKDISHLYGLLHIPVIDTATTSKVKYLLNYFTWLQHRDRLRLSVPILLDLNDIGLVRLLLPLIFEHEGKTLFSTELGIQLYTNYVYNIFAGFNLMDNDNTVRVDVNSPFEPVDPIDPLPPPIVDLDGGAIITPFPYLPIITPGAGNGYYSAPEEEWTNNTETPFGLFKVYDKESDN